MKRSRAVLLSLVSLIVLLAASTALARGAVAQGPYKVGLVVRFGDGSVFTDCVEFTSPEITGEDVLDRSGLSVIKDPSYGLGAAVCKIGNNGCNYPTQHCFCKCTGEPPCLYWAYYYLDQQESAWIYSGMGASWHTVQAGDVEGWAWGDGEYGGSAVEPPSMTFEELCSPPSPPVVDLSAEPENIIAGQCSTVRWTVENAVAVILDGEGVRPNDTRYVCPTETHLYELQVLNAAGEYSYEVTVTVTQPSPTPRATATATRVPTATTQPSGAPPPTATRVPQAPAVLPSPSPTLTPIAMPTSIPTLVAMVASDTPTAGTAQVAHADAVPPIVEPNAPPLASEAPPGEAVGLDRILLLLGVGAGTVGFGTIAFLGMLLLLVAIYLRARTQF